MVPLRVRSYFSLRTGTASPAALCSRAREHGYERLALTDQTNLYGLWDFLSACERTGIRPIVGVELSENGLPPVVLLVENDTGYANLCTLVSRVKCSPFAWERVGAELLEGLVFLAGSIELLEWLHEREACVVADLGSRPTQAGNWLRKRAMDLGRPAVATPDSDMAENGQNQLHALLRAIDTGSVLSLTGRSTTCRNITESLAGPDVYKERFAMWPDALTATEEVAERCTFTGPNFGTVMPPWQSARARSAAEQLRDQAYRGARYRYGEDLSETVVERLEYELAVIETMGFSSYFLVVRDIVHPLQQDGRRKQRRICGRGSGAASLVAYCLGVTNVCPIRYNLYFERFLNPGRSDPPDLDIDFAWDERDDVLTEVLERFGERAAMVCNHVCFKPRMAIRETARAYGMPGYEISRMTKRLPWFMRRDELEMQEQMSGLPALKDQDFSGPWRDIISLASELIGLPRYLSVHPGGMVITPGPVHRFVPVERAPKGVPIIQWEKDGTEEAGLVKIDLLGNRSLGVIRDAVQNVRRNDIEFSERTWEPEDDGPTRVAVSRGRTMGCFYIESPAMRLLQQKAGSGDFEQLVIQSSIIRPAANEFVREYVRRLHGGAWEPLHPELESVLDETFGLMVYQEDVSRVAVALAGFSHSDADGLRKVMSKKDKELRLRDYRAAFFTGCAQRGLSETEMEKIWSMMMSFDGYSFCKPHSASYARVSYQAAYLKTHFPAEFMAAVISNQGGYYSTFSYVSEAKRMGLSIDPPDVRLSEYRWRGRGKHLRVGLQAVSELQVETARRITTCRCEGPFRGLGDFLRRVRPADNEVRSLIDAGALDSLNPDGNRSTLFWEIGSRKQRKRMFGNTSLFTGVDVAPPPLAPPDRLDMLRSEYRALGFLCHGHPIMLVRNNAAQTVKAAELARCVGRSVQFAGWLLTGKMVSTKTGEVMEFLTFEDETGIVETTFFPGAYRRYAHILASRKPYLLTGLVESDYGAVTLTVDLVHPLEPGGGTNRTSSRRRARAA